MFKGNRTYAESRTSVREMAWGRIDIRDSAISQLLGHSSTSRSTSITSAWGIMEVLHPGSFELSCGGAVVRILQA